MTDHTDPTPSVEVHGQRIEVQHLALEDAALAAFLAEKAGDERLHLVEQALRIGLMTICSAGVSVSVDVVRTEFTSLLQQMEATQQRAGETVAATLRENFADADGRLPRTLEHFLGDESALRRFINDLFDENRRDSAMGKLRDLLGEYFDSDNGRLTQLLDPTRDGSPLYQFRREIGDGFTKLSARLVAIEAGRKARDEERERSAAKGADFEDALEARLCALTRGTGDLVERTGAEAGDALHSKKGDFVITIDPAQCRGHDLRIAVEAKNRSVSIRRFEEELEATRQNRRAAIALAVFSPLTAPAGVAPLKLHGTNVFCTFDHEADAADADAALALEAAYRLARALALASLREAPVQVDVPAIQAALDAIQRTIGEVQGMKTSLTSIATTATGLSQRLDGMRRAVSTAVGEIEQQLHVVEPGTHPTIRSA